MTDPDPLGTTDSDLLRVSETARQRLLATCRRTRAERDAALARIDLLRDALTDAVSAYDEGWANPAAVERWRSILEATREGL